MIFDYFLAYTRNNKSKTIILVAGIAVYFAMIAGLYTVGKAIPDISRLPLRTIGVNTLVQREGVIPDRMEGIVFPHANGPIYTAEYKKLTKLDFVEQAEAALYFWDFTGRYKSVLGIKNQGPILHPVLKNEIEDGSPKLDPGKALAGADYMDKRGLLIGDAVHIKGKKFVIGGRLKASGARAIPADLYIDLDSAQALAGQAPEIKRNYRPQEPLFYNVALLQADPEYFGDKDKPIKSINAKFLIYSEKTFSKQISENLKLLSGTGKLFIGILGLLFFAAFASLIVLNIRTREEDISILRALGWDLLTIKKHFLTELGILLAIGLVVGFLLYIGLFMAISGQQVTMEIPWEISAKPHFLSAENDINRQITADIPIEMNLDFVALLSFGFSLICFSTGWLALGRLKKIKADRTLKNS